MLRRLTVGIHEFIYTLLAFPRAWRFMRHHRLWEGLRDYGWVANFLIVVGIIVGLYTISEFADFFSRHADDPVQALFMSSDSAFVRLGSDAIESMSDGALKWVVLVLLEVVIYHFMRRTLAVILKRRVEDLHSFTPFFNAQKRMIIVSFIALIVEGLLQNLAETILPGVLSWPITILISAAFLGFVIADNYNEQFELNIKQSVRNLWRNYIGICIGLGLPLYVMLQIPLLGAIIGPLVTSVTAGIVLRERSDLHIIGYQMSEKERAEYDRKQTKRARKEARKVARRERRAAKA